MTGIKLMLIILGLQNLLIQLAILHLEKDISEKFEMLLDYLENEREEK